MGRRKTLVLPKMKKYHIASEYQSSRSYSPVVVTEGGRTIYLAGIIAPEDEHGRSLAGDFDEQVRCIFRKMSAQLSQVNATLADVVSMTVFITDVKLNTRMVEIRSEFFKSDFPASTLVTVAALNRPEMLVEITAIAVSDSRDC
jgi:2-iminobutanoate/2-iminopropanoate deaminase